jgi:hypothetical protein
LWLSKTQIIHWNCFLNYNSTHLIAKKSEMYLLFTLSLNPHNLFIYFNPFSKQCIVYLIADQQGWSYSCSRIVSGDFSSPELWTRGNLVFLRISMTSAFLLNSSPSFCPEVKWLHMKQKLVWCKDMLTEIDPCSVKQIIKSLFFLIVSSSD